MTGVALRQKNKTMGRPVVLKNTVHGWPYPLLENCEKYRTFITKTYLSVKLFLKTQNLNWNPDKCLPRLIWAEEVRYCLWWSTSNLPNGHKDAFRLLHQPNFHYISAARPGHNRRLINLHRWLRISCTQPTDSKISAESLDLKLTHSIAPTIN